MSKKTIAILKSYFETGDRPTEQQFADLIDSFLHKDSGVVTINRSFNAETGVVRFEYSDATFFEFTVPQNAPISFITGLQAALNNKVDKEVGKGLSTLDFTNALSEAISTNSQHATNADIHVTPENKIAWDNKVDKIEGKGLSTNDYDAAEARKVTDATTHVNDESKHVSAAEKTGWNNKITDYYEGEELSDEMGGIYRFFDTSIIRYDGLFPFTTPATPIIGEGNWERLINPTNVVNDLTTGGTEIALSAEQGVVLKGFIDVLNSLLESDNLSLDTLQELVDFIEVNRTSLENLTIGNISGLQNALDTAVKLTGIQTVAGAKTFSENLKTDKALLIKHGFVTAVAGYLSISAPFTDAVGFSNPASQAFNFRLNLLTATRNLTIQDKTGTIALLSDVTEQIAASTTKPRPEKYIVNTTQYTAVLEDKNKHLVFQYGVDFIVPAGTFAKDDVLEWKNEGAADLIVNNANITIQVVSSQSRSFPQYAFGGLRFRAANTAGLYGQIKPI